MKVLTISLKLLLSVILLMPILGGFGVFPAPTAEMYNTPQAFEFIQVLMAGKYIMLIDTVVFILAFIALWANRLALASLLLLPVTVNIVAFHLFLDGGLFTSGAVMGNVLLLLNLFFLWRGRNQIKVLFAKTV